MKDSFHFGRAPSKHKIIILYYLPPLIWVGVIFFISSIPDLKSELPSFFDQLLRKLAHMIEFGILAILLLCLFLFKKGKAVNLRIQSAEERQFLKEIFLTTFILTVLYAFSDEFHQSFVVGRNGSLWDVLIDTLGIAIGIYLFVRWKLNYQK